MKKIKRLMAMCLTVCMLFGNAGVAMSDTEAQPTQPPVIESTESAPEESSGATTVEPAGETAAQQASTNAEESTEAPVEDPVEEAAEETTEEPVEEAAEENTEEPTEETTEETIEEPAEENTEGTTEEPVEETTEENIEEPAEENTEGITEEPVEEPTEETIEETTDENTEETTEEPAEENTEENTEETTEEPVEEAAEENTEEPTEETTEETIEEPVEEATGETPEEPIEEASEESTDVNDEEATEDITAESAMPEAEDILRLPETVLAVQNQIDALPDASVLSGMAQADALELYNRTQSVYGAYAQLPIEEQAMVDTGKLEALFNAFNSYVAPIPEETEKTEIWFVTKHPLFTGDKFDPKTLIDFVASWDGNVELTEGTDYTVTCDEEILLPGDYTLNITLLNDAKETYTVEENPTATICPKTLSLSDCFNEVTYDGTPRSAGEFINTAQFESYKQYSLISGYDDVDFSFTLSGEGVVDGKATNAGTYTLTATLSGNDADCYKLYPASYEVNILPAELKLKMELSGNTIPNDGDANDAVALVTRVYAEAVDGKTFELSSNQFGYYIERDVAFNIRGIYAENTEDIYFDNGNYVLKEGTESNRETITYRITSLSIQGANGLTYNGQEQPLLSSLNFNAGYQFFQKTKFEVTVEFEGQECIR